MSWPGIQAAAREGIGRAVPLGCVAKARVPERMGPWLRFLFRAASVGGIRHTAHFSKPTWHCSLLAVATTRSVDVTLEVGNKGASSVFVSVPTFTYASHNKVSCVRGPTSTGRSHHLRVRALSALGEVLAPAGRLNPHVSRCHDPIPLLKLLSSAR